MLHAADSVWRLGQAEWATGNRKSSLSSVNNDESETIFSRNNVPLARFRFEEALRMDAAKELGLLQKRKLTLHVLSGDCQAKVTKLLDCLGAPLETAKGELSPQEKAAWLREHTKFDALMLGDGANDSLAFDQALCRGTPVVHRGVLAQKADFYYLGQGIKGIRALFETDDARRRTHRQLLVFSIAYNLAAVGIAVAGHMNPLLAAILMPASSLATLAIVGLGMRSVWIRA